MQRIVFYSWQSDLPNVTNRAFIQRALEEASKAIAEDDSVAVEPVVDRDTQGVAGSPDIASTIFGKIAAADVVVADVSIVGRANERPTPNPNVLIELGYALRALGHERVILVFNTAFGKIAELPFDLRMRRVVPYSMAQETTAPRSDERASLAGRHVAPPAKAVADELGTVWNAGQGADHDCIGTRRGSSNIFHSVSIQSRNGANISYTGTIGGDGVTVTGMAKVLPNGAPWGWRATIVGRTGTASSSEPTATRGGLR